MDKPQSDYRKSIEKIFKGSRTKTYPKNQLIHYQDDPLSYIYMLKRGFIKAYTILESGDTRTMLILSMGDVFPLVFTGASDWDSYTIRYFYQTLTDTEVCVLPGDHFKNNLETNKEAMSTYINYLSASNEAIMNQLEVMKNKKAIDKVGMLLPYLVSKSGKKIKPDVYELQLKLSHQEIADISGVTRETTTTLIKELEKDGIIDQRHGKWLINIKALNKYIAAK